MSLSLFRQIAHEIGVSPRTVRRVLTAEEIRDTRPTILARTERIRELARQLNYRPNSAARAVARGRFNALGLLLSTVPKNSVLHDAMIGIQDACRLRSMHLMVGDVPDEQLATDGYVPKLLREWAIDGLLINYTHEFPPKMLELIERNAIPSIWLNTKLERDCIYPDDFGAGRLAAQHLTALGHRRLIYVMAGDGDHYSHYSRRDRPGGFEAAAREAGASVERITQPDWWDTGQLAGILREHFARPDRATGVFVYGSRDALLTAHVALGCGLRVPEDLSIVSLGEGQTNDLGYPMTTLLIPQIEMGAAAVELLLRRVAEPEEPLPPVAMPFHMAAGVSTAPPPAKGGG